jgi:hypothetical protein
LPFAVTVFGNLSTHLDNIANQAGMQYWVGDDGGLSFGGVDEDLTSINENGDLVFAPPFLGASSTSPAPPPLPPGTAQSLIGTPVQTLYGVSFRVLLDPRVQTKKPLMTVKIDTSQILFLKRQIGQNPRILDSGGVYVVVATRHIGDSRGNTWETQIDGISRSGNTLAMLIGGVANANLNAMGGR